MRALSVHSFRHSTYIPDHRLLDDLASVAVKLNKPRLSQSDYAAHGRYSFITICRRFGSWREAVQLVGCEPAQWRNVPAEKLLADLKRVAGTSNRLTANQYRAAGKYSMKTPYRLYGRWQHALAAAGLKPGNPRKLGPLPRGLRTIPASLRYRVLLRDHFRCVACGGSPAKDGNVTLEVDHKFPWSLGGSTRIENLQTLCRSCNKGKSDRIDPAAPTPKLKRSNRKMKAVVPPLAPDSGRVEPGQSPLPMKATEYVSDYPPQFSPCTQRNQTPEGD